MYQISSIWLMNLVKFIHAVPLTTDSTKLSPREMYYSSPSFIIEEDSGSPDLVYSSGTQDTCLSSQIEFLISSTELGLCPGAGTKQPEETTPLPPVNLDLPDLLDVFGIGGEDEQSPDAVNQVNWDNEDLNPCRGRNPYRLHVCCEGELGIFDGDRLYSIEDCVIRTYRTTALSIRFRRTGFMCRISLMGFVIVSVTHLCFMAHEACCRGFVYTTRVSHELLIISRALNNRLNILIY